MHRFDFIYLLLLYVLGNALGSTSSKNANATLLLLVLFVSHKLLCVDAECGCFVVYLILCHYHFSRNAHIHGRTHEIRKKTLSTYFFIGCSRSIRIILLLQCFFQFFLLFVWCSIVVYATHIHNTLCSNIVFSALIRLFFVVSLFRLIFALLQLLLLLLEPLEVLFSALLFESIKKRYNGLTHLKLWHKTHTCICNKCACDPSGLHPQTECRTTTTTKKKRNPINMRRAKKKDKTSSK